MASLPLTEAAVRELLSLPTMPFVPADRFDDARKQMGWVYEHDCMIDSFITGHGHVIWSSEYVEPLGNPDAYYVLTFTNSYPQDPEHPDDDSWVGNMQDWADLPGWRFTADPPMTAYTATLAQATSVTVEVLGPPNRTVHDDYYEMGSPLPYHLWHKGTHVFFVGPATDNFPFGHLTMGVAALHPWPPGEELPAADADLLKWLHNVFG